MGHFWSLTVEDQFYLIWPLIVFAVKRRETLIKICLGICILCPIPRLICAFTVPEIWLILGFQERFIFVQFEGLVIGGSSLFGYAVRIRIWRSWHSVCCSDLQECSSFLNSLARRHSADF